MKKTRLLAIATGIGLIVSASAIAADRQVPTAPKDYLDMKNPVTDSADAADRGKNVYQRKCKKCHGVNGDAKAAASSDQEIKPVAFTAPGYLKGRADGQMFFIIEKGSPNTDMEAYGPGSETNLSKEDIWSVIAYLRKTFTK